LIDFTDSGTALSILINQQIFLTTGIIQGISINPFGGEPIFTALNVQATAVPEPATYVLLGSALGIVALAKRRRAQA